MMPRVIGSWIRALDEENFAYFFRGHPQVVIRNARREAVALETMEGLLLTGGPDVSVPFLHQPVPDPSLIHEAEPERDEWEFAAVAAALARRIPILAVCKGVQVLNVALGGTLHLDIPGHGLPEQKLQNNQPLEFAPAPTVRFPLVNSSHHQALDRLGQGLEVEAWSQADHIVEQVRLRDYPFAVGVQYHPERHPSYYPLFDLFAQAVLSAPGTTLPAPGQP